MNGSVLVTGGAGYIGSHVVAALARAGTRAVVLDDLSNSSRGVLDRLAEITGEAVPFVHADVRDRQALRATFAAHPIAAVVHCAGLKAVGESGERPLAYWDVNVGGTFALAEVMGEAGVATLVFSSSATVYGQPDALPVGEESPVRPQSVYGRTKRTVEDFLRDLARGNANWRIAVLRYFNPAGAHPSARIGEAPRGRPNNLVPLLCRTVAGDYAELSIYGTDWPTPDGTGVRDYIHVEDLAEGHVAARRPALRTASFRRRGLRVRGRRAGRRAAGLARPARPRPDLCRRVALAAGRRSLRKVAKSSVRLDFRRAGPLLGHRWWKVESDPTLRARMFRFYVAQARFDAFLVADRLNQAGIRAHVFNQHASSIVGDVPPDVAQPQVWLEREADRERAGVLLARLTEEAARGGTPRCAACG